MISFTENRVTKYFDKRGKEVSIVRPWLGGWMLEQDGQAIYFSDSSDAHYNAKK